MARRFFLFVLAAVAFMTVVGLWGCRSVKYVPAESIRTEYIDRYNTERVTDSVTNDRFVYVNGDTVVDIRWRDRWRTEIKHDSIYINKTDTIRVPYPVERKLSRWERTKMDFGGLAIGGVIAAAVIIAVLAWLARKRRK